ncbi:MAG: CoA transferase [Acidiphilium sp. 37-64-53]|uniref:CaiB/BaiF CoA transferase family protein n=2 Tax=Acidocellaceae TaxID=3385905 RepID=UPI000BD0494A|nr:MULTISPECIES: CoA transferase [Acidiphilium]OYW03639.1 MAG: CoA transferase [Acidiphilium sp. 37-64-53]HQT84267.1 CoA transferase [Acidiphilium rubrum]
MTDAGLHEKRYEPDAPAPLKDIRVLDLSRLVAGNVVTHVLADFGADVIKVENPKGGDDLRNWRVEDIATHWKVYARNKRSLALDYRDAEGLALLLRLAAIADVLVENFIPGKLERMGLGPDVLFAANPHLIVVRISGWGQTGPFAGKPGFGSLVEAMSGFATMNGFPDRPPVLPPLALADMITGLYGATAIMIALRHVEVAGGAGQVIDLSLFESMLSVLGPQAANYALTGTVPTRHGSRSGTTAPRNVYCCADGKYVALSASMQVMAERLFRVMGRPDLITDPRFATNTARVANNDILDPIVAAFMAAHTQAEALAVFEQAGVTVGPVCDPADLMDSQFIREREALISLPDADMGRLPMHNIPARLSATPGAMARPAPALGADTTAILRLIDVDPATIETLQARGVLKATAPDQP